MATDDRSPSRLHRLKHRLSSLNRDQIQEALRTLDVSVVEEGAKRITEADVEEVVERTDALNERFATDGPLGRFVDDGRLLLQMVRDAWNGTYRALPYWTMSAAAFTLLYVLNPMDLVPDALPAVGLLDDATVLSLCLMLIEQDLAAYRAWKQEAD